MTQRHPQRVTFNLKTRDGSSRSYPLTGKNFVVGPNGSGKSVVAQAFGLAVTGAADNVSGRAVTTDAKVIARMGYRGGADKRQMFAEVDFDQGERCRWDVMQHTEGTGLLKPSHIRPSWVEPQHSKKHSPHMPMRALNAMLSAGAKTARKTLIQLLASAHEDETLLGLSGLSASQMTTLEQLTPGMEKEPFIDRLVHAAGKADELMREANSDVRATERLKASLSKDLQLQPTPEQLLAARDMIRFAENLYEETVANAGTGNDDVRAKMQSTLAELRTHEQRLDSDLKKHERQYDEADHEEAEAVIGALTALRWSMSEAFDQCPLCSSAVGVEHLKACQSFYEDRAKDFVEADTRQRNMATLEGALAETRKEIRRVSALIDELPVVPVKQMTQEDVEKARDALHQAREAYAQLTEQDQVWVSFNRADEQMTESQDRADDMRKAKKAFQVATKKLLAELVTTFEDRVRKHLPDGWLFGLFVGDDRSDAFYPGLYASGHDRNSEYLMELSEGQRAAALAAMACALHEYNPTPVSCITVEDRGFDEATLGRLLQSLVEAEPTVFFTATTRPPEASLKGWNVIDLYDEAPAAKPKLPPPPKPVTIIDAPAAESAVPTLPDRLLEGPDPYQSGRARGGRFRSAKNSARKFLAEYQDHAVVEFMRHFPDLELPDASDHEAVAVAVANYLTPVGPSHLGATK